MHPPHQRTNAHINKFKEEKKLFRFILIWNFYSFCLFCLSFIQTGCALLLLQFLFLWARFFVLLSLSTDSSLLVRDKNFSRSFLFRHLTFVMTMMLLHFNGTAMRVFYTMCDGRHKNKTIGFILCVMLTNVPFCQTPAAALF